MRDPVGLHATMLHYGMLWIATSMCEHLFLQMTACCAFADAGRACPFLLQVICADGHTCESGLSHHIAFLASCLLQGAACAVCANVLAFWCYTPWCDVDMEIWLS